MHLHRNLVSGMALVAFFALLAPNAGAVLLFHETFDYANDSVLHDAADWTGSAPANQMVIRNGDTAGDNSSASLAVTGITGTGGRLLFTSVGANGTGNYTLPEGQEVTGDNATFYWSFLYKPITAQGGNYVMHNRTNGSTQSQMGRIWTLDTAAPNALFGARIRDSASLNPDPGPGYPVGTTIFVVTKTTIVPGDTGNDTFEIWINPTPGSAETTATVTSLPEIPTNNIDPVTGFQGFRFRTREGLTGVFEFDELRIGTTWEDVTALLGSAGDGDGDGDGDGGGGSTADPDAGMPVAGAIGLGLLAGAAAFAGAFFVRGKK